METSALLVSRPRAAQMLSVSERTIDRLCDVGQLRRIKVGRRALVLAASIDEYLERALHRPTQLTDPVEPKRTRFAIPALEQARREKRERRAAIGAAA